jgi:hypothetical protein
MLLQEDKKETCFAPYIRTRDTVLSFLIFSLLFFFLQCDNILDTARFLLPFGWRAFGVFSGL